MTLEEFNSLADENAVSELERCCGSNRWINGMKTILPFDSVSSVYTHADEVWNALSPEDWKEAFTHHPKIGDIENARKKFASTSVWAEGEQRGVQSASEETLRQLADGNLKYEKKFGYIFILCATGKSADEMLSMLNNRLSNNVENEIYIAAEEQRKITRIRLEKLFSSST
ncbi:MAG: 2-oxo-4-hydroxy-4-carboxy-5-ureidoimidazoline decarboxylase [Ignavibacteriales bacterium]|nr:2-oxo-4-hydroxy-4-carboxy-5-ureidoimidazoline decarboxylase [Ignavibacteriales bacterium]